MRPFVDFYSVLGVHPSSSQETIRASYRRLAKRVHPDVSSTTHPTLKMQAINEAYHILGDPRRRASYDRQRYAILTSHQASAHSDYRPPPPPSPAGSPGSGSRTSQGSHARPRPYTPIEAISHLARDFARSFFQLSLGKFILLVSVFFYILLATTERIEFLGGWFFTMVLFVIYDYLRFRGRPPNPP